MSNIEIWYRRKNESKYHRITRWINRNNQDPIISWKRNVNDKLFQFTLKLYNPLDEDSLPFIPNDGDEFVVTDWQNNIYGNSFIGILEDVNRVFYGLDDTGEATNKYYNILVQNKDFSTSKGTTERLVSSHINDLLPEIFNNTPDLGGVLQNGIVIPKHDFGGENFLFPPLKIIGSQYERLLKLLDLISWTFTYFYYSELHPINGLHIIKQIIMFPKNVGKSPSWDWQKGITFQIYRNGFLSNIEYPYYDDRDIIICEKNITYKKSNRELKNSIELKLNIKSNTSDNGKKFRQEVTENKNTFDLGGTFDVKSVAIEVITFISSVTSDSVFIIPEEQASAINYYQERMNNNALDGVMWCRINSGGNDYDRIFTLDILTNTITLVDPISGLINGSEFTLTGAYDLLPPNLTSYPPDGNGYVIKNLDSEKTTIKFTDYDMPNIGHFITGYYYPIETQYKTKNDPDSISKVGFRGLEDEIKEPITEEQAEELFTEYRKRMKPLEVFSLNTSHRKNILDLFSYIDVDFEDIKGRFIVTGSEGRIIHDEGFYRNTPLILQDIELSSYSDNLSDVLAKIQNNSKALTNLNLKNNVEEIIKASIFIREVSNNSLSRLITPIMLDPTNILNDRFTMNFISSNTQKYKIVVSNNIDFTDTFNLIMDFPSIAETEVNADIPIYSFTYPIYVKIQAIRGTEISSFSNIKQVSTFRHLITNSNTKAYIIFQNDTLDQTSNNNDMTNFNASFGSSIIVGDSYSQEYNGSNAYSLIPHSSDFHTSTFAVDIAFKFLAIKNDTLQCITNFYNATAPNGKVFFIDYYNDFLGDPVYSYRIRLVIYDKASGYAEFLIPFAFNTTDKNLITFSYKQKSGLETESTAKLFVNGNELSLLTNLGTKGLDTIEITDISDADLNIAAYTGNSGIINDGNTSYFGNISTARYAFHRENRNLTQHQTNYNNLYT